MPAQQTSCTAVSRRRPPSRHHGSDTWSGRALLARPTPNAAPAAPPVAAIASTSRPAPTTFPSALRPALGKARVDSDAGPNQSVPSPGCHLLSGMGKALAEHQGRDAQDADQHDLHADPVGVPLGQPESTSICHRREQAARRFWTAGHDRQAEPLGRARRRCTLQECQ